MASLCDSCKWYNKKTDEFLGSFDDVADEKDPREKHGCIMYTGFIPQKIWYENGECSFYVRSELDGTGRKG